MNLLGDALDTKLHIIEEWIRSELIRRNLWRKPKVLADMILKQSNFYIENPRGQTPWEEPWCQAAQLAYFLPLNFLRNLRVRQKGDELGFFAKNEQLYDFGCGLSPTAIALGDRFKSIYLVDRSRIAMNLAKDAVKSLYPSVNLVFERPPDHTATLLSLSYSFTELNTWQSDFYRYPSVMLIEPSTQEDARNLSRIRDELIEKNYFAWAPCTHQAKCPLLKESKRDWCFDRIKENLPDWMLEIEKFLPMKNERSLTLSYLLISTGAPPTNSGLMVRGLENHVPHGPYRVIGDALEEKGKTRRMICGSDQRLFLTQLKKDVKKSKADPLAGSHEENAQITITRGDRFIFKNGPERKGNELRIKSQSDLSVDGLSG